MIPVPLPRRLLAEFLGSALLAAVVIGSGIAAQRLSPGDIGLELLENAAATAVGLYAIILMFGAISGAHLNPVVSLVDAGLGGIGWRDAFAYLPAQVVGCCSGAVLANLMFASPAISLSTKQRASGAHWLSEVVATIGLLLVIFALARTGRGASTPAAVGAYIGAAYFFTSSTSFANPAITVGRMLTNSFAGIRPASAPGYIAAQFLGGAFGLVVIKILYPNPKVPTVLFACVHNSGRSVLGQALLAKHAQGRVRSLSAGSEPGTTLNPSVVAVLAEEGIDVSGHRPTLLTYDGVSEADVIITMGCGETCPVFPGKRYEDWELPDPKDQDLNMVRALRDDIERRVITLLATLHIDGCRADGGGRRSP